MYGTVSIDGKTFIERYQTLQVPTVTIVGAGIVTARLVLPSIAPFWIKGLVRDAIAGGISVARRFRSRFTTTDMAGTWFQSTGAPQSGIAQNDRILDTLLYGSAQFPKAIVPHVMVSASGTITVEIEDLSAVFPYDLYIGFDGSFLLQQ